MTRARTMMTARQAELLEWMRTAGPWELDEEAGVRQVETGLCPLAARYGPKEADEGEHPNGRAYTDARAHGWDHDEAHDLIDAADDAPDCADCGERWAGLRAALLALVTP